MIFDYYYTKSLIESNVKYYVQEGFPTVSKNPPEDKSLVEDCDVHILTCTRIIISIENA